jgi:hypothetical protein
MKSKRNPRFAQSASRSRFELGTSRIQTTRVVTYPASSVRKLCLYTTPWIHVGMYIHALTRTSNFTCKSLYSRRKSLHYLQNKLNWWPRLGIDVITSCSFRGSSIHSYWLIYNPTNLHIGRSTELFHELSTFNASHETKTEVQHYYWSHRLTLSYSRGWRNRTPKHQ